MITTLEITTTVPCVNKCPYCPQRVLIEAYSGQKAMDMAMFKAALKKLPHAKIHFSGFAEPFGHPDCINFILEAYRTGHKIGVYTNGMHIRPRDMDILSLLTIEPFVLHVPPSYEVECSKAHEKLNEKKIKHDIYFVGHNQEVVSRAGNIGKPDNALSGIIGGCTDNRHRQPVLLPDGTLALCCMDYGLRHVIGNILSDSIDDIHKKQEEIVTMWRVKNSKILCRGCNRAHA